MRTEWINHQRPNLRLYFAGWGTPPSAVAHLSLSDNEDLLICYDYQDLQLDFDFSAYQHIHLVAWSMGVWVAEQVLPSIPLTSAIAINGTGKPCDDDFGIPESIFSGTLNQFSESNLQKFQRRMCGNKTLLAQYQQLPLQRSAAEIQAELTALYQAMPSANQSTRPHLPWTKAIIGKQDKIFPAENQRHYWQQYLPDSAIVEIADLPHYPFATFQTWSAL